MTFLQWNILCRFMSIVLRYIRINARINGIDALQTDINKLSCKENWDQ